MLDTRDRLPGPVSNRLPAWLIFALFAFSYLFGLVENRDAGADGSGRRGHGKLARMPQPQQFRLFPDRSRARAANPSGLH